MKRNEKRAWSRKPENSRILMQMSWTHMNPTSTFILRSFSVLDTQPCRFVWFVVLNVFKLFLFKTKPNTIIYNFSDVFWNLESDSVSKTDHEGVKPNQNQNQEVYCSTKKTSYVTQIYNSGSVYIGQANHEASWNMNWRISFNIYDNTTLSMDHVNAPCIIEHVFLYRSCSYRNFGPPAPVIGIQRPNSLSVTWCCRLVAVVVASRLNNEDIRYHELNIRKKYLHLAGKPDLLHIAQQDQPMGQEILITYFVIVLPSLKIIFTSFIHRKPPAKNNIEMQSKCIQCTSNCDCATESCCWRFFQGLSKCDHIIWWVIRCQRTWRLLGILQTLKCQMTQVTTVTMFHRPSACLPTCWTTSQVSSVISSKRSCFQWTAV